MCGGFSRSSDDRLLASGCGFLQHVDFATPKHQLGSLPVSGLQDIERFFYRRKNLNRSLTARLPIYNYVCIFVYIFLDSMVPLLAGRGITHKMRIDCVVWRCERTESIIQCTSKIMHKIVLQFVYISAFFDISPTLIFYKQRIHLSRD